MNIDELQAGREMDALVAEKVMGYQIYYYGKGYPGTEYYMLVDEHYDQVSNDTDPKDGERQTEKEAWEDCPLFSTDTSAAWEVEERIKELELISRYTGILIADIGVAEEKTIEFFNVIHATPLQRCRAALKAMGAAK